MFKLSRIQFFLFLFIAQTGTVFISFQSTYIDKTGRNAWLIFIIAGVIHYVQLLLYEKYYKDFKLGPIASWLYKGYWLLIIVAFISYVDYTLAVWAFPQTPQAIVIAVMVSISLYANLSRPETIMNLSVILIPLIPLFIGFLFLALPDFVWTNLFPVGDMSSSTFLKGLITSQFTFIGIELYLFFRSHVHSEEKINGLPLFVYQVVWMLFYFSSIVFVLLYFTLPDINLIPEPIMYILKSQHVTFVERLDLFFIYIWMTWSIITVALFSFTTLYVHQQNGKGNKVRSTIIFHLLLVILPLFIVTKQGVDMIQRNLVYFHLFFSIIMPTVVILMNRRRKK